MCHCYFMENILYFVGSVFIFACMYLKSYYLCINFHTYSVCTCTYMYTCTCIVVLWHVFLSVLSSGLTHLIYFLTAGRTKADAGRTL